MTTSTMNGATMMTLADIRALRPTASDSTSIAIAIEAAETAMRAALDQASEIGARARQSLLTAETAEILAMEAEAGEAKLTADRIAALLDVMRPTLAEAQAREEATTAAALMEEATRLEALLIRTWDKALPAILAAALKVLDAKRAAEEARALLTDDQRATMPDAEAPAGLPMAQDVWLPSTRLRLVDFVTHLAALSPAEVEREAEESAAREAQAQAKAAAAEADRAQRAAFFRAEMARQDAEAERRRVASTIPARERAVVRFSGGPAPY